MIIGALCLVSCIKEQKFGEHIVVYSINHSAEARICLHDDAEWMSLLNRFCDLAKTGKFITFHNADRDAKGSVNIGIAGISSVSRKKIKLWMMQMEREGMIVNLVFENSSNSWSSMSYYNDPPSQDDCCTGKLVSIPVEYYSDYPLYPYWGLKVNEDTVFRIVKNGSYRHVNELISIEGYNFSLGDTITLCGSKGLSRDSNYDLIYILDLDFNNYPDNLWKPYPLYCSDGYSGTLMVKLVEDAHKIYCTSAYDSQEWQGKIGGGIFSYEETTQTDSLGNPIIMVYNDAISSAGSPFSIEHRANGDVILRDLTGMENPYQSVYTPGSITLQRTYTGWETWACDTMGFNIVMHINNGGCVPYYEGYFSSPFYVNCTTPFKASRFINDDFRRVTFVDNDNNVLGVANFEVSRNGSYMILTPVGEPEGCAESYVFYRIERPR